MRYFLDTEFLESGERGAGSIDLISIALVCEDGREYYAENKDVIAGKARELKEHEFLRDNVLPHLQGDEFFHSPKAIAQHIIEFVGEDQEPEFWGYFCDYDWVVFCWLFGKMVDLPEHFPKYCRDLKQLAWHMQVEKRQFPRQEGVEHHALNDAKWNLDLFRFLVYGTANKGEPPRGVRDLRIKV